MRATLLALGLLLGTGMAGGVKLYTVTIKTTPALEHVRMGLIRYDGKKSANYGPSYNSNSATWKLPAGKYRVVIFNWRAPVQEFEVTTKDITANKNQTITVALELLASITPAARQAWNSLLIDMQGTEEACGTQTASNSCAEVPGSFNTVKSWIGLHDEFEQLAPWLNLGGDLGLYGQFRIGGVRYGINLSGGNDGTFLGISRSK